MAKRFFTLATDGARTADVAAAPRETGSDGSEAGPEPRFALLIGNSRYEGASLRNPVRDVRRLAYILGQLGFTVTMVENAEKPQMERAITGFAAALDAAGPQAVAFLHFAGHGLQQATQLYLIPAGTGPSAGAGLSLAALSLESILAPLHAVPLKALVAVADVCRTRVPDEAPPDMGGDALVALSNLSVPAHGTLIVYSTALGSTADDGDGATSPYASALAERLPLLIEPGRRIHEAFVEAAEAVRARTEGTQSPALLLQGALPPLALGTDDARRRAHGIRILPPRVPWMRLGVAAVAGVLLLAFGAGVWFWRTTYPEERIAVLARWGLATPEAVDTMCAPPWDAPDRFGLTRADWCGLTPAEIVEKPAVAAHWTSDVAPQAARGNAKALMLEAARLLEAEPKGGQTDAAEAIGLVQRAAAAQGLPMADAMLHMLRTQGRGAGVIPEVAAEAGFRAAARAGYLPALIETARLLLASGQGAPALDVLRAVQPRDETGVADLLMAEAYGGAWPLKDLAPDHAKAVSYLKAALAKGNLEAARRLLRLDRDGEILLPAAETLSLARKIAAKDAVDGLYWQGLEAMRRGPASGLNGGIARLEDAARKGSTQAMLALADTYARGIPDPNGRPALALDPQKALRFYQDAVAHGDPWAGLEIADLFGKGALGAPDRARARAVLAPLAAGGDARLAAAARERISTLDRIVTSEKERTPWDVSIGAADAPVSVVAYFPIGTSVASAYYLETLRPLMAGFVPSGLARFHLRLAWGWQDVPGPPARVAHWPPEAPAAAAMLSCVAPDRRPELLDRLASTPEAWVGKDMAGQADFLLSTGAASENGTLEACLAAAPRAVDQEARQEAEATGIRQLPIVMVNGKAMGAATFGAIASAVVADTPARLWSHVPRHGSPPFLLGPARRVADDTAQVPPTAPVPPSRAP